MLEGCLAVCLIGAGLIFTGLLLIICPVAAALFLLGMIALVVIGFIIGLLKCIFSGL